MREKRKETININGNSCIVNILGDSAGGHEAMTTATRTLLVVGGGAAGSLTAGPAGGAFCAMNAGLIYDALVTTVTDESYGIVDTINNIRNNPTDPGNYIDLAGSAILDGYVGKQASQYSGKQNISS
jgi:hypothetical protein